jgi:cellulose synthase/poly-beta-1,6-N-acetylglucosamine synthase-like glycosyltransferase
MILCFTLPLCRKPSTVVTAEDDLPFVSVVVAARNEERNIRNCLESILGQDYPADRFEVIVSDDHSTDRTKAEALLAANANLAVRLTLLDAGAGDGKGKKRAIERAVRAAKGTWILTTDADTGRETGWLRTMATEALAPGTRMVLGPVRIEGVSCFGKLQALEFAGVMGLTAGSAGAGLPLMCNGANLMYRKEDFENAGGLGESLRYSSGDDQFLLEAFRKKFRGKAIRFAMKRSAVISTGAEETLAGFLYQRMRWVSKSRGYRDPVVIAAGALTYLLQVALLLVAIAGSFHPALLLTSLGCWGLKIVAELPLVARTAVFLGIGKSLGYYVPAQLFQLVYVPVAGMAGLILPYRWKDRVISA